MKLVGNACRPVAIVLRTMITTLMRKSHCFHGCLSAIPSENRNLKRRHCEAAIPLFKVERGETLNRDVSVQIQPKSVSKPRIRLQLSGFLNERRGTQISHLYTGNFRYNIGSKLGFNVQYRHEDILAKPETATDTTATSTSYYSYGYGRNRDEKTDSGSITLDISPINAFSLNPSYDIRRTLERRDPNRYTTSYFAGGVTEPDSSVEEDPDEDTVPDFSIAEREHRLSLTPRLNRDLLGLRPTVTSRVGFRRTGSM